MLADEEATETLLNARLTEMGSVEYFETYRYVLGKDPADIEPFLDMPSSRPRLFFFSLPSQMRPLPTPNSIAN